MESIVKIEKILGCQLGTYLSENNLFGYFELVRDLSFGDEVTEDVCFLIFKITYEDFKKMCDTEQLKCSGSGTLQLEYFEDFYCVTVDYLDCDCDDEEDEGEMQFDTDCFKTYEDATDWFHVDWDPCGLYDTDTDRMEWEVGCTIFDEGRWQ
ncbi:hypothetical protein [Turicibacter sanguinis]|uniref:hypothetical protein n=1 Tax=Turicibacter sanguinis TaxID=154288 RepID=UPI0018A05E61|nr:hypothetical protein [Turicibacter sanguinis]